MLGRYGRWLLGSGLGLMVLATGGWWWRSTQVAPIAKAKPSVSSVGPSPPVSPTPAAPWAWSVQRVMDRTFLPTWFRQRGVHWPRGTAIYAARITPG
ncbi:MAG: hypothetical protein Q6K95_03950, partial [Gloeomargarita sp. GXS_bins_116]